MNLVEVPLQTPPSRLLPELFWAMACDLHLETETSVQSAYGALKDRKYVTFLKYTDSWSSQLYETAAEHRRWNQLAHLLSKYPFNDPSIDRDGVALQKFLKSEHRCRRVNAQLRALESSTRDHPTKHLLVHMRRFIRRVLGPKPDMRRIYDGCGFGPGSSIGVSGDATHVGAKVTTNSITVSSSALPYALAAVLHNRHYCSVLFERWCYDAGWVSQQLGKRIKFVEHNNITCVPKNAKTSRTIATESLWNGFVQKGIDLEMRRKLRKVGVTLNDQYPNQELAWLGSKTGDFVTIDLSAASDSVSTVLCRLVLPPRWFQLLDDVRARYYKLPDGSVHQYEKFCSMGNGFCFPLESLLFAAIVDYSYSHTETPGKPWCVYGDDIVVTQNSALYTVEMLRRVGFRVNTDKSFFFGPFRESCGADFHLGENVRPTYFKTEIVHPVDLYPLANALYRNGYKHAHTKIVKAIPSNWRYFRPYQRESHGALECEIDQFIGTRHARWNRDWQAWTWKEVIWTAVRDPRVPSDDLLMLGKLQGSLSQRADVVIRPKSQRDPDGTRLKPAKWDPSRFSMRNNATLRFSWSN